MLKRLQTDDGRAGEVSAPYGSVELLLDGQYLERVIDDIKQAKHSVFICAYAWRNYGNNPSSVVQRFNALLCRKRQEGVNIKVLADNEAIAEAIAELGLDVRVVNSKRVLHTKAILVDDSKLFLGSHNLTMRATEYNFEASLRITELEPCLQFRDYFLVVWGQNG